MALVLNMNNQPLPKVLSLIAGSSYPFKVKGLGRDKRHLELRSTPFVEVKVVRADDGNSEQLLLLKPADSVQLPIPGVVSAYQKSQPGQVDSETAPFAWLLEPKIDLLADSTEAGMVMRMLLVEAIRPGNRNFVAAESLEAMQWMRHVMMNRLKFGRPQLFGAEKGASTLAQMIMAKGQVEGFENYPKIASGKAAGIAEVVRIANTSGHKDTQLCRQFIRDASDVASGVKSGKDPYPTGLYAWRTAGAKPPGGSYVKYKTHGGQDFYRLDDAFRIANQPK